LAVSAPPVQAMAGLLAASKPVMASSAGKSCGIFIAKKGAHRRCRGKKDG
jgi:hypothetical protein